MILLRDKDGWVAFEVVLRGTKFAVTRRSGAADVLPPAALRRATTAVPWEKVACRRASLPLLVGGELRRALSLQLSFHCADSVADGYTGTLTRPHARGVEAVLLGVPRTAVPAAAGSVAVPAPLAWLALARHLDLIPASGSVLVVHADAERLQTVLVTEGDIGLIRDVPLPVADPALELRLAAQALYLRGGPELVEPGQLLWFGEHALADSLPPAWRANVRHMAPADLLTTLGPDADNDVCLAAAGISLGARLPKPWRGWCLQRQLPGGAAAAAWRRAGLAVAAVVVLSGLAAWAGLSLAEQRLTALARAQDKIEPACRQSEQAEAQVKALTAFLDDAGAAFRTPSEWRDLLRILGDARPDGMQLTAVGGVSGERLSLTGRSARYEDVTDYMKALQKNSRILDLGLVATRQIEGGVEFTLTLLFDGLKKPLPPAATTTAAGKTTHETD